MRGRVRTEIHISRLRLYKGTNGMYVNIHVPNNVQIYIYIQCMSIYFEGNHCLIDAILRVRIVVI